jgi:hypothetical protein
MKLSPLRRGLFLIPLVLAFFIRSANAQEQDRYTRIQLKNGGQYLDADHCGKTITLNPGSDYDGGSCQLWRKAR